MSFACWDQVPAEPASVSRRDSVSAHEQLHRRRPVLDKCDEVPVFVSASSLSGGKRTCEDVGRAGVPVGGDGRGDGGNRVLVGPHLGVVVVRGNGHRRFVQRDLLREVEASALHAGKQACRAAPQQPSCGAWTENVLVKWVLQNQT